MRRLFIAGNWKMNMKLDSAKALAEGLKTAAAGVSEVDIAVCPPYLYVPAVAEILAGSNIGYGAQNVYFEKAGAFTGEIETAMLTDFGCKYVILGHSERRHIMGESSELVNKKVHAALAGLPDGVAIIGNGMNEDGTYDVGQDTYILRNDATQAVKYERTSSYHRAFDPMATYYNGCLYVAGYNATEPDAMYFRSTKLD